MCRCQDFSSTGIGHEELEYGRSATAAGPLIIYLFNEYFDSRAKYSRLTLRCHEIHTVLPALGNFSNLVSVETGKHRGQLCPRVTYCILVLNIVCCWK